MRNTDCINNIEPGSAGLFMQPAGSRNTAGACASEQAGLSCGICLPGAACEYQKYADQKIDALSSLQSGYAQTLHRGYQPETTLDEITGILIRKGLVCALAGGRRE